MRTICRIVSVVALLALSFAPTAHAKVEGFAALGPEVITSGWERYPNATTILVSTYGAGVFKSTDSGATFAPSGNGLPNGNVNVLSRDLATTPIHYAGMDGHGIYKSTDTGGSWTAINTGLLCYYINHVSVHPTTFTTIYAATGCGSANGGVFRSTDGGANWSMVSGPSDFGGFPVRRVFTDRVTPTKVYATTSSKGFWRSDSSGDAGTWVQKGFVGQFVQTASQLTTTVGVLVASVRGSGLYLTLDGGDNWTAVNAGLPDVNFAGGAGFDENDPGTIYVSFGNRGIYKGTLSGSTINWTLWNSTLKGTTTVGTSTTVPGALFATGNNGYYKSIDNGANWTQLQTGLPSTSMNDVQTHPTDSKLIYATNADAVWKSTDGGINWARKQVANVNLLSGLSNQIAVDPADANTLWVSSFSDGIYKSIDGGTTFNPANTNLPAALIGSDSSIVRGIDGKLYAGFFGPQGYGIYRSDDGGGTWAAKNVGLSGCSLSVRTVVPNPATAATLYAVTSNGICRSTDSGDTWVQVAFSGTGSIRDLVVDPANPATIYAARSASSDTAALAVSGVWKSTTNGTAFVQTGLNTKLVQRVGLIRDAFGLTLLAAVWPIEPTGLYASDDGVSWGPFTTGLRNSIRSFDLFANGPSFGLRIAGYGMGVRNYRAHYGADFNNSSTADLFWRHQYDLNYLWLMNAAGVESVVGLDTVFTNNWKVGGIGDIDDDGQADIIWYYAPSATAYAWLMSASGIKPGGVVAIGSVGPGWTIEGIGDMNNDGVSDILWRHTSGLAYAWYLNAGGTIKSVTQLGVVPTTWRVAGIADLNNDGAQDIIWVYEPGGTLSGVAYAWMMDPNGIASPTVAALGVAAGWTVAKVADFDGDGKSDLFWRDAAGNNAIWFMNGTALREVQLMSPVDPSWKVAAAGDFDGDGLMDIVWYYAPSGLVYQWFMNGPGAAPSVVYGGLVGPNWELPGQ